MGLRGRLLLMVAVVVALAVTAVGFFTSRVARRQVAQFMTEVEVTDPGDSPRYLAESHASALVAFHHEQEGWQGVETLLAELGAAGEEERDFVLLGPDDALIATTMTTPHTTKALRTDKGGFQLEWDHDGEVSVAMVHGSDVALTDPLGQSIGTLVAIPSPRISARVALQDDSLGSLNRWLFVGVVAAGMLALALTAFFSSRMLRPIGDLTIAARQMASGDLTRRVGVKGGDEVAELSSAFNTMADSLANIEQLRRNMVSDVAHELRTPLTNIRCQLEGLQDGLVAMDRRTIDSLHEETLLLSRLVHDLQELALAEAGQLLLEPEAFAVQRELRHAGELLQASDEGGAARLRLDVPDLPPAYGDPHRFRQVVMNLVRNALAHTPETGSVAVSARVEGKEIEVAVADEGPGIPAQDLELVFERFYRADRSRNRATGGSGLGLAIVKQLVEAAGGRVWAESEPGRGSTFRFTLPLA